MSTHEGVSCDCCMTNNFTGKRFKCLQCYDYDLCASCYESEATSSDHVADHPVQCILTSAEHEFYFPGDPENRSYTCPFCGTLGFTASSLFEHVTSLHDDTVIEVICPICAATSSGEPNYQCSDFAAHLDIDHRESTAQSHTSNRSGTWRRGQLPRQSGIRGGRRSNHSLANKGDSNNSSSAAAREIDNIADLMSYLADPSVIGSGNGGGGSRRLRSGAGSSGSGRFLFGSATSGSGGGNRSQNASSASALAGAINILDDEIPFELRERLLDTVMGVTGDGDGTILIGSPADALATGGGNVNASNAASSSSGASNNLSSRHFHLRMLERDLREEEAEHERLLRERSILQQMRQQLERLPRHPRTIDQYLPSVSGKTTTSSAKASSKDSSNRKSSPDAEKDSSSNKISPDDESPTQYGIVGLDLTAVNALDGARYLTGSTSAGGIPFNDISAEDEESSRRLFSKDLDFVSLLASNEPLTLENLEENLRSQLPSSINEDDLRNNAKTRALRSLFVQQLILNSMAQPMVDRSGHDHSSSPNAAEEKMESRRMSQQKEVVASDDGDNKDMVNGAVASTGDSTVSSSVDVHSPSSGHQIADDDKLRTETDEKKSDVISDDKTLLTSNREEKEEGEEEKRSKRRVSLPSNNTDTPVNGDEDDVTTDNNNEINSTNSPSSSLVVLSDSMQDSLEPSFRDNAFVDYIQ